MGEYLENRVLLVSVIIMFISIMSFSILQLPESTITGNAIAAFGTAGDHTETINKIYSSSATELWTPEKKYSIRGIGLTGSAKGDGVFKAFILDGDKQKLIYSMYLENEEVNFTDICRNTCGMDIPLKSERYLLRYEIDGLEVNIESIQYSSYTLDEGIFERTTLGEFLNRVLTTEEVDFRVENDYNIIGIEEVPELTPEQIAEQREQEIVEEFEEENAAVLAEVKEKLELKATVNSEELVDKVNIYADREVEILFNGIENHRFVIKLRYDNFETVPLELVGDASHSIIYEEDQVSIRTSRRREGYPKFDIRIGGFE